MKFTGKFLRSTDLDGAVENQFIKEAAEAGLKVIDEIANHPLSNHIVILAK